MSQSTVDTIAHSLHDRSDVHLARKIWHMSAGLTGLYVYFKVDSIEIQKFVYFTLIFGLVALAVDFTRLRIPALNKLVLKMSGPIARSREATSYSGIPFFALGVSATLFLYHERIAILAILFLVFADPISSYFGVKYGRNKILPGKSFQGSAAGFCTCYGITLVYSSNFSDATSLTMMGFSLLAGVVGAASELASHWIDDNFTIPVGSGLGLTALNYLFQVF